MDFPVAPMDSIKTSLELRSNVLRLPIFPDEAASAAALIELIGGAGRAEKELTNGSGGAVVGGFGRSSAGQFGGGAMCGEETSVAAGGPAVSMQTPLTRAALKHILMEIRAL
ncbi:hypothetical protein CFC21_016621 [Triticum aestivum]|uniref:Uncharacterized protein n=3 Tax=Triticum TaxID=4564 RepID=A0A9R1NRQ9_TRITD|nr:hypothetical protein CFC21_016621 [Triticum aestivum]VAH29906.1 unnamed protein product [Triticum turgidum subsp. durum]